MIDMPEPGLYRTTLAYPGKEDEIPANALVYVGNPPNGGLTFVVRPGANRKNQWFWGEPTVPIRATSWAKSLKSLPPEGFYTLPYDLDLGDGGRWVKNAIVQLGYNGEGRGIIFVGERHDADDANVLRFSDRGVVVDDNLLFKLVWAPILPVAKPAIEP